MEEGEAEKGKIGNILVRTETNEYDFDVFEYLFQCYKCCFDEQNKLKGCMNRSRWLVKYSQASFFNKVGLSLTEALEIHKRSHFWFLKLHALHFFKSFRDLRTTISYFFMLSAFFLLFFAVCQVLDGSLLLRLGLFISIWAEIFEFSSQELNQHFDGLEFLYHLLMMTSALKLVFCLNAFEHEHVRPYLSLLA